MILDEGFATKVMAGVTILTLLGSLLGGAIVAGVSYGSVSSRVTELENSRPLSRQEWEEFRQDISDRLGRIENKIDKGR